jgi:hypothetical protein
MSTSPRFNTGDLVRTPDGAIGRVVGAAASGFQEGDADGCVLIEVDVNGMAVQRVFAEEDLQERL